MRESIMNYKVTKYRYLKNNLKTFPVKPIIKYTIPVEKDGADKNSEFFDRDYPVVTISNRKFSKMIEKTANALVAFGVKKDDIITICQTNTPEIFYMDYALNKIGARANYIYPNVTADEMKYYIEELDSKYLFILDDDSIRKNVKEALKGTKIKVISSSVIESFPAPFKRIASKKIPPNKVQLENEIKWQNFIKNGKGTNAKEVEYKPDSVCCYIHTSGTSSVPKAVMMSNENVNAIPMNYEIEISEMWGKNKVMVQTIPQFVSYGLTTIHLGFCENITLCIIPEMDPRNFYDLMKLFNPNHAFATPSHAREMIKRPLDMSNTEHLCFGGDGFDDIEKSLNAYIKENGGKYDAYQGYGSTEMSAVALTNTKKHRKDGSLGITSGETKAVIVEPDTFNEITEPNVVGELCLTGPGMTLGYAGNSKEENDKVFVKHPDGITYVHMGDLISRDEDGFFFYHGRIKNVIARKSFKFSPDEIIKVISSHENVKQCVIVPKYSKEEGETPSAHIVLEDMTKKDETLKELLELVNQNIQELHRPTDYNVKTEIVRTRNNKNDITALKIEDSAKLLPGVLNAEIKSLHNGDFDYSMSVSVDTSVLNGTKSEIAEIINNHIKSISQIMKFNVGKIDYIVE